MKSLPVCTSPKIDVDGSSQEIDRQVRTVFRDALSVYDVQEEVLEELKPTHILTQSQCDVCAVSLKDVQNALSRILSCNPEVISLEPNDLDDVFNDISRVAIALESEAQGHKLVEKLKAEMSETASKATKAGDRPSIACIEWIQPLMIAGNWMPRLVRMAGGQNAFSIEDLISARIKWERLKTHDPEIILVTPCGFNLQRTQEEMYWLERNPEWSQLRAVQNDSVFIADGNQFFNRPGPRLSESLQILAEITHPSIFPPKFENIGWKRFRSATDVEDSS